MKLEKGSLFFPGSQQLPLSFSFLCFGLPLLAEMVVESAAAVVLVVVMVGIAVAEMMAVVELIVALLVAADKLRCWAG